MQALVTGGSGFIGSELIRQLLEQGVKVRALLRKTSPRRNLEGLEFETAFGDLGDFDSLKKAVQGVDYVFHLAGAIAAKNREEFFRHNADGTENLARACAEVNPGLKRFVHVSSIAACGPAKGTDPRREEEPNEPVSYYGESKLAGEEALLKHAASFPTSIVRPPAVYGPRDKAIFEFVKVVNSGIMPMLPSTTGQKYYSVVHVDDLVHGIVLAGLSRNQSEREVFFICGDGTFTWQQMMAAMADGLGKKTIRVPLPLFLLTGLTGVQSALAKVLNKSFPLTFDKLKELKQDFWICSNERAKKTLGFQPKWEMRKGLSHTIDWYQKQGWL